MNRKTAYLIAAMLLLGVGLAIFFRKPSVTQQITTGPAPVSEPGLPPISNEIRQGSGQFEAEADYKARTRAQVDASIATNAYPEYARYYLEQRRVDKLFDWKQPIDFYGKVIDENGQPIEGASA